MPYLETAAISLLSEINVDLSSNADTIIYTVPTGKTCVLAWACLVAGSNTGASQISIGQSGSTTDWIPLNTLAVSVAGNAFVLQPVPNTTTPLQQTYPAGTVIKATVANHAGGATNALYLFGFLF
jgi:hypothetical protein